MARRSGWRLFGDGADTATQRLYEIVDDRITASLGGPRRAVHRWRGPLGGDGVVEQVFELGLVLVCMLGWIEVFGHGVDERSGGRKFFRFQVDPHAAGDRQRPANLVGPQQRLNGHHTTA